MRLRLGCVAVIAYPIVEITLAVVLAQWVGWWWLLVYVVACIVLGLGLVRYALGATGRSLGLALEALRGPRGETVVAIDDGGGSMPFTASTGRPPSGSPAQTLLIVPAGLLIAIPGIVTTFLGLVMWLPQIRARIAGRMERAARRMEPPPGMGPQGMA